jgi:hypothetical protein
MAALGPAVANAATGSISGTVTDASTAEPMEGVEVCAEPADEGSGACGLSETDGTYFIGGLSPGGYKVSFWAGRRYEFEYYDGVREWSKATLVEVVSGANTPGIDADLELTATIEGTVLATEDGLGVAEVEVCAYPANPGEETFFSCDETTVDGSYAIAGLEAGSYKVEFWTGWTSRRLAYQFWDHKSRYPEADVITLAANEQREGIGADLAPGALITGSVHNLATGKPVEEVRVCSIDATIDKLATCTWTNEDGSYGMRRLPAGSYKVVFSPERWEFFPGEGFPGEEDDGFPTQFWNSQSTIAAANVITLGTGGSADGINASYGKPPFVAPIAVPAAKRPVQGKCRRGYKKKLVHGKRRCVKVHKHRRHRHKKHGQPAAARFFAR